MVSVFLTILKGGLGHLGESTQSEKSKKRKWQHVRAAIFQ